MKVYAGKGIFLIFAVLQLRILLSIVSLTRRGLFNPLSANPTKWSKTLKTIYQQFIYLFIYLHNSKSVQSKIVQNRLSPPLRIYRSGNAVQYIYKDNSYHQ